jgi:hypothetical protein
MLGIVRALLALAMGFDGRSLITSAAHVISLAAS